MPGFRLASGASSFPSDFGRARQVLVVDTRPAGFDVDLYLRLGRQTSFYLSSVSRSDFAFTTWPRVGRWGPASSTGKPVTMLGMTCHYCAMPVRPRTAHYVGPNIACADCRASKMRRSRALRARGGPTDHYYDNVIGPPPPNPWRPNGTHPAVTLCDVCGHAVLYDPAPREGNPGAAGGRPRKRHAGECEREHQRRKQRALYARRAGDGVTSPA